MDKRQFEIKICRAKQILEFRSRVLRPGENIEAAVYEGDEDESALHLGAFAASGLVVGCATFIAEPAEFIDAVNPYRLRGMAADPQGLGTGKALLRFAFDEMKTRQVDLLWCKAREVAFPFYEAMGFIYHGEMFDIPRIGPHKLMYVEFKA